MWPLQGERHFQFLRVFAYFATLSRLSGFTTFERILTFNRFHVIQQVISPIFERLAQQYYPSVKFYKVDVDEAEKAISEHARITAMPTFIVFRKGEALEGVRGAVPKRLQVSLLPFKVSVSRLLMYCA